MTAAVVLPSAVAARPARAPATVGAPSSVRNPDTRTVVGSAPMAEVPSARTVWLPGPTQSVVPLVLSDQYDSTQSPASGTVTPGVVCTKTLLVASSTAVATGDTEATPS